MRVLCAVVFALTPWLYIYANCIGTEGFSNPLVYLVAACGWSCLRTTELNRRKIFIYFGLLLAAALTRQINGLLAAGLPIALLPLAGKELIPSRRRRKFGQWSIPISLHSKISDLCGGRACLRSEPRCSCNRRCAGCSACRFVPLLVKPSHTV